MLLSSSLYSIFPFFFFNEQDGNANVRHVDVQLHGKVSNQKCFFFFFFLLFFFFYVSEKKKKEKGKATNRR